MNEVITRFIAYTVINCIGLAAGFWIGDWPSAAATMFVAACFSDWNRAHCMTRHR
jgi:hypothetical protein